MMEILVARILSVALLSHYAFVAVSLAMFGLGLSGLIVYLFPGYFRAERIDRQIIIFSAAFALTIALSIMAFLRIPVVQKLSIAGFLSLSLAYLTLAIPFFLGGVCISLFMTHFSSHIGKIYFWDLFGASLGCLGVVGLMSILPAPILCLLISAIVAAMALCLCFMSERRLVPWTATVLAIVCVLGVAAMRSDLYEMRHIKNRGPGYSEYAVWNSFSRISAFQHRNSGTPTVPTKYFMRREEAIAENITFPKSMMLDIDGSAWTPMLNYNGDPSTIQFFRGSVIYAAHHLKKDADVLVIGIGGGRDILASVAFDQKFIQGIEMNPLMYHVVNEKYGDYSGHVYTLPNVDVIIDEARSRLHRLDRKFDVVQLTVIDTFSANAAGGFVFHENFLYTRQAFQEYFHHLKDDGILTITRHYVEAYPLDMLRLAGLARAAWEAEGITPFDEHIIILTQGIAGTILVKRTAFTADEIETIKDVVEENRMRVLYLPGEGSQNHPEMHGLITGSDFEDYISNHPYRIHPPTDNEPFYFSFLRHRLKVIPPRSEDPMAYMQKWDEAMALMYMLVATVGTIAIVFFLAPLILLERKKAERPQALRVVSFLLYFACLGYGFMMIEIPLLQRFILFLGHPVYSLSVVLFSILMFSGIGSLLSSKVAGRGRASLVRVLIGIAALGLLYAYLMPIITATFIGVHIVGKIAITVLVLAPMGLLLGMPYPLGIGILREYRKEIIPWAWSMNGVMSVFASVMATFIASRIGFTYALMTGLGAYLIAAICYAGFPKSVK